MQQINLYQIETRGPGKALSALHIAVLALASLALLGLVSALLAWQGSRQQALLEQLQARKQTKLAEVEQLAARFPPPRQDAALQARLERMEAEARAKDRFLQRFGGDGLGSARGFSPYLAALAEKATPGLWLSELWFREGGVIGFGGSALQAQAVPAFVARLGEQPVFQGHEFRTLKIERAEEQPGRLDFVLKSAGIVQ